MLAGLPVVAKNILMPADNSGVSKWGWILPAVETALSMGFPTMMEVAVMRFLADGSIEAALSDPLFLAEAAVAILGAGVTVWDAVQLRAAAGAYLEVMRYERMLKERG